MTTTLTPPRQPDPAILNAFDGDGYAVIRQAIDPALRTSLLNAAEQLLSSDITRGRDQGGDGKDGFRGCLNLHRAFLPLLANPRTLPTVVGLLSPNEKFSSCFRRSWGWCGPELTCSCRSGT